MSWDLEIFGPDRPDLQPPPVELEERGLAVDGPFGVDDEDLPAAVARVLLTSRWTVQINLPSDLARREARALERYARAVADASGGVLYDPQADEVVWPRKLKRLREPQVARDDDEDEDEAAVLELQWLVNRQLTAADGDALLDVLDRRMPEALPRRFGTFEPMQGRLERHGRAAFTSLWDEDEMVSWKGRRPFEWGFASLWRGWGSALTVEENYDLTPVIAGHKAPNIDSVSLTFGDDVAADPRWCDALADLFGQVTERMSPFFAAAFMRWDDDLQETHLMGRYWLGVPDAPLWLVWVGDEYRELLPEPLPGGVQRIAERPTDFDALRANGIGWPSELVRRPGDLQDESLAAPVIPKL